MSKKLFKVIGAVATVVAGVAAIATGFGAVAVAGLSLSTIGAAAGAVALGSSLLAGRPKPPETSPADRDRLIANIDTRTPRKGVLGLTAMATDIRDQEFEGSEKEYFHRFLVAAGHKSGGFEAIYFDDKLAWTSSGGVQGEFVGYLNVAVRTEGSAANAINISARMGTSRRFTGLAYVHFRYKLTGNNKNSESPFAQAIPTRVTIIGKGLPVYDPRKDDTRGGSGGHRIDNQATWDWDDDGYRNPALQTLAYLLGWKINGKLSVGKGVPPARIDVASFAAAANNCDEPVTLSGGGTEPRYRTDGIFSEADNMSLVLDQFKSSMNATLDDVDGQIRLSVLHNDLALPVADFDENDLAGPVDWKPNIKLTEKFNIFRGTYTDPSTNSLYQSVAYPELELASEDGIDRIETINYPLVQSPSQCQRLIKQRAQRMQHGGILKGNWLAPAWAVQKGDIVRQSIGKLGFSYKVFRVMDTGAQQDGLVPMVLREEHADNYAWDAEESPAVVPAAPDSYDHTKNPLYRDIAQPTYGDGTLIEPTRITHHPESRPDNSVDGSLHFTVENEPQAYKGREMTIGGNPVTVFGETAEDVGYVDVQDKGVPQALSDAATAQARADKAVSDAEGAQIAANHSTARLQKADDDGWITIEEKASLIIPENGRLEGVYATLINSAATFSVDATALTNARLSWITERDAVDPAWNDTTKHTKINRNSWDAVLEAYRDAAKALEQDIAAKAATLASLDGSGQITDIGGVKTPVSNVIINQNPDGTFTGGPLGGPTFSGLGGGALGLENVLNIGGPLAVGELPVVNAARALRNEDLAVTTDGSTGYFSFFNGSSSVNIGTFNAAQIGMKALGGLDTISINDTKITGTLDETKAAPALQNRNITVQGGDKVSLLIGGESIPFAEADLSEFNLMRSTSPRVFSGDDDAQRNNRITVDGSGILSGIGTLNIPVSNNAISVDGNGFLQGISGTAKRVSNSNITVEDAVSSNLLRRIGGGTFTGDTDADKAAGKGLAFVDSTAKTKLDGVQAGAEVNPADLAALDSTRAGKLDGISAGATVGATAGLNFRDEGGTVLGDIEFKNREIILSGGDKVAMILGGEQTPFAEVALSQINVMRSTSPRVFSGDDDAQRNSRITVDGSGILSGIGTLNIPVSNNAISVDGNGFLQGISGTAKRVSNSNITVDDALASNLLRRVGSGTFTGDVDAERNSRITVSGGVLSGIGTANIFVDNDQIVVDGNGFLQGGGGTAKRVANDKITVDDATASNLMRRIGGGTFTGDVDADKAAGKGLAFVDSSAKTKLDGVQAGAEVNPADLAALDSTRAGKLDGIPEDATNIRIDRSPARPTELTPGSIFVEPVSARQQLFEGRAMTIGGSVLTVFGESAEDVGYVDIQDIGIEEARKTAIFSQIEDDDGELSKALEGAGRARAGMSATGQLLPGLNSADVIEESNARKWAAESEADKTDNNVPIMEVGMSLVVIPCDHEGVPLAGDLATNPINTKFTRKRGGVDVSDEATFNIEASPGITCSVSSNGMLSITGMTAIDSFATVSSMRNGVPLEQTVQYKKELEDAPEPTGVGTKATWNNGWTGVGSDSWTDIGVAKTVHTGANGDLTCALSLTTSAAAAAPDGTFDIEVRWRISTDGGSNWSTIGASQASNPDVIIGFESESGTTFYYQQQAGSVSCNRADNSLTADVDILVKPQGRRSTASPAKSVTFFGTATATGS